MNKFLYVYKKAIPFILTMILAVTSVGLSACEKKVIETPSEESSTVISDSFVEPEPEVKEDAPEAVDWQEYRAVCHALGITESGDTATNSREAFLYNYERGLRVFEGDIQITSDNVYVLRHDWILDLGQGAAFGWTDDEKRIPTAEEFLNVPVFGKYTPMTLATWFELMKEYPDVWFITDSKFSTTVTDDFKLFVDTAKECGCEEVLKRVIVQLYYPEMYEEVNSVYPFDNYILTLYYIGFPSDPTDLLEFLSKDNVKGLTMPAEYSEFTRADLHDSPDFKLYVHTIDDYESAVYVLHYAYGLYTDNLTEVDLAEIVEELN